MTLGFQLSAGTIPGRSHLGSGNLLIGKNNQDTFNMHISENCIIAIVCDGCGSGSHSEIGASIGGRLLMSLLLKAISNGALPAVLSKTEAEKLFEEIRKDFLKKLSRIASAMTIASEIEQHDTEGAEEGIDYCKVYGCCSIESGFKATREMPSTKTSPRPILKTREGEGKPGPHTKMQSRVSKKLLHDYFLFTLVGFVVTAEHTITFSIGDGIVAINGDIWQLGPFPNNAPPYVTYALMPDVFPYDAALLQFKIHAFSPTDSIDSALIATDGMQELIEKQQKHYPGKNRIIGDIRQIWSDDRFFSEGDSNSVSERELITPWLRQINSEVVKLNQDWQLERSLGLLSDDTTIVALRRKPTRGT